jgi:GR25 family glycosyltransferase involved in LPS biosynthesis
MNAFVITIKNNKYSEQSANTCISTALPHGLNVNKFEATTADNVVEVMKELDIEWKWKNDNSICPTSGLKHVWYKTSNMPAKIACAVSHYRLWKLCVAIQQPIIILEHDSVFINPVPHIDLEGICQLNDPAGATKRGGYWHNIMSNLSSGIHDKTLVAEDPLVPDGLAGNSAYYIHPEYAAKMIHLVKTHGLWPNDALMCIQLIPELYQYYPFITKVNQTESTTV